MSETSAPFHKRFARELTAAVLVPTVIWLTGWVPLGYAAFIIVASVVAHWELMSFGEAKGWPMQKILSSLFLGLLIASLLRPEIPTVAVLVTMILVITSVYALWKIDLENALAAAALSVFGTLYLGLTGAFLVKLRLDFDEGGPLVFFLLILVWSNDSGAYYSGRKFGKTKLAPRVSPKKTVEGLVGGLVACMIAAVLVRQFLFPEFPVVHALIAGLLVGFSSVLGDLAESVWKRSAGVKDSGNLIPGHGGFLDRGDSVFFTAPILYGYWFLLQNGVDSLL